MCEGRNFFSLILFNSDLKSYFKLTKYQKKKKEKSKKIPSSVKEKEERKRTHLVLVKLTCGSGQSGCMRKLCSGWNLHGQSSCVLCCSGSRSKIRCSSEWSINIWWHTLFFIFRFLFRFSNISTFKFKYIFCLFFQITQPTETYKKRVKIKKLVSKIFQKIPRTFREYFTTFWKLCKNFLESSFSTSRKILA